MAKNWAIVIGINNYYNLQKLDFAENDAKEMEHWFRQEAKFDKVFLFTEKSDPIPTETQSIPTEPTFGILMSFLEAQFRTPLLTKEDNLWFFFSGHGQRYRDKDYLMLRDTTPGNIERTAISVEYVTERLRRSGADNVILLLDACRNQGARDGLGYGEEQYQGVITFYSCRAEQRAWEISELGKGAFTHTLLEGLRLHGEGNCATVYRLYKYLENQLPELNKKYGKPKQNPYLKAEPPYKMYYILLPESANSRDILRLKFEAMKAEFIEENLKSAKELWTRVLAVASTDTDALSGIERIAIKTNQVHGREEPPEPETRQSTPIEYKELEVLLKAQNFKAADEETYKIMLKVANRQGFLRKEDAEKFPCEELRTIDQLWLKYSQDKFGISIQQQIYQSLGGTKEYNRDLYNSLGDHVGWRRGGEWLSYNQLTFSQEAVPGHLPSRWRWAEFKEGQPGDSGRVTYLLSRLQQRG